MADRNVHIDRELLELAATGDELSFRILYDRFSAGIYRTAYRYLRNPELAEDIVQETFLTLWANRGNIGKIESPESYIFVLARNQCLRVLKEKSAFVSSEKEFFVDLCDEPADAEDERFAQVYKAIDLLPPQQKIIFEMAKLKGLSHEKISRELNLSPSTVNNHITAAFRSIRNYMRRSASEIFILTLAIVS